MHIIIFLLKTKIYDSSLVVIVIRNILIKHFELFFFEIRISYKIYKTPRARLWSKIYDLAI